MSRGAGMRVLMYAAYLPPQYSGAAKQAVALAKHLRARGHHIEFVTIRWPGLGADDSLEGFRVHRIASGPRLRHREVFLWWNLLRFSYRRRRDFDVIHGHGATYRDSVVGPVGAIVGWPSVAKITMAGNDLRGLRGSRSGWVHYAFLRSVRATVATTSDLEKEALEQGIPRRRVHLIPNGVDTHRFRPATAGERAGLRRELGLPLDGPIVLSVGVFDPRKGLPWLVEVWARGSGLGTPALLVAVGPESRDDPGILHSLQTMVAGYGDKVQLVGPVDDIERYYRACDVFVLPSFREGMPNVVLEAMASGLPCAGARVSGTRELVRDGVTGATFTAGDVSELAAAVGGILAKPNNEMGTSARQLVESRYSLEAVASDYERLYEEIVRGGFRAPSPTASAGKGT